MGNEEVRHTHPHKTPPRVSSQRPKNILWKQLESMRWVKLSIFVDHPAFLSLTEETRMGSVKISEILFPSTFNDFNFTLSAEFLTFILSWTGCQIMTNTFSCPLTGQGVKLWLAWGRLTSTGRRPWPDECFHTRPPNWWRTSWQLLYA